MASAGSGSDAGVAPTMVPITDELEKLLVREDLTEEESFRLMDNIAKGLVDPCQIAAFLVLLRSKGETSPEIAGLAKAMQQHSVPLVAPATDCSATVDVVGTGGDGHDTVNISTSAAILAAACGVPVAKHGSVSFSSKSGSANVLQSLGIPMLPAQQAGACLDKAGITFMFAPNFHPAMRHVGAVRRSLKVRTVFNILGPLLNPFKCKRLMLGVYSPGILDMYAAAAARLGAKHALVVHCCGLDELAPIGIAEAVEIKDGEVTRITINPAEFGVPECSIADLKGGGPEENAAIIRRVFAGGDAADCAIGHTIALNAGAALYVAGTVTSIDAGYRTAYSCLLDGDAAALLERWSKTAQSLMPSEEESK